MFQMLTVPLVPPARIRTKGDKDEIRDPRRREDAPWLWVKKAWTLRTGE